MEKIVAYCGIICSECAVFTATQKNDIEEKRRVAKRWKRKVEDINCDGCLTEGPRLFRYCEVCKIRKCGQEKQVKSCAYCTEYPCETLSKSRDFKKDVLDNIRASLHAHRT